MVTAALILVIWHFRLLIAFCDSFWSPIVLFILKVSWLKPPVNVTIALYYTFAVYKLCNNIRHALHLWGHPCQLVDTRGWTIPTRGHNINDSSTLWVTRLPARDLNAKVGWCRKGLQRARARGSLAVWSRNPSPISRVFGAFTFMQERSQKWNTREKPMWTMC